MKAPYKHRLLLLLDEFPALGKLGIFEQEIAYFGDWNIKAYYIFGQDIFGTFKDRRAGEKR